MKNVQLTAVQFETVREALYTSLRHLEDTTKNNVASNTIINASATAAYDEVVDALKKVNWNTVKVVY